MFILHTDDDHFSDFPENNWVASFMVYGCHASSFRQSGVCDARRGFEALQSSLLNYDVNLTYNLGSTTTSLPFPSWFSPKHTKSQVLKPWGKHVLKGYCPVIVLLSLKAENVDFSYIKISPQQTVH